jgi:solute carrier family 13 (sodium-dependent dicarboxylate transporter), member 2/3/5
MPTGNVHESLAPPIAHTQHEAFEIPVVSGMVLGPLLASVIWLLPMGIDPTVQKAYAIVTFMIVYWIAQPIEHAVTALIGCYLFWALGVVKFPVAFKGFATTSPWFVFGGALIAEAVSSTGLAKRLGYRVLHIVGTSYSRLLLGVTTLSFLITYLIPSGTARITIIASILIGVVVVSNSNKRSNVAKGLFLAVTNTCGLFDKMILAGAGSILTHGIIKEQTGIEVLWSQWFFAFLPVGLLSIPACWLTVLWLYPGEKAALPEGEEYLRNALKEMGPLSAEEKKVLAVIGGAIALWMTDFLHHLNPTVIGLGAGLFLALPGVGVLNTKAIKKINFLPVAFAAGAISLASVLAQTKALDVLNLVLMEHITPFLSNAFLSSITLYWGGFLYHFVFPNNQSLLGTSLPLLLRMTHGTGYNPVALALIWGFAGGATIFPFQSTVLVIGYSYGYFHTWDLLKVGAALAIVESIFLIAAVTLYWPLIGLTWIK